MQLQLVSSKMAQMFDTLLKPGLTLPQKRQTCYIWWGVRGEGSWGFGRLSHNLLTLLSLYPPHPSEGPSSTSSLFREKWCCCQQQHGEAYEHSQTQWRKPYMLCSPYTGYIIIITPPLRALPFSLTPSSHGELNCISGLFFGDWLKERKQNEEGKKEKERGGCYFFLPDSFVSSVTTIIPIVNKRQHCRHLIQLFNTIYGNLQKS